MPVSDRLLRERRRHAGIARKPGGLHCQRILSGFIGLGLLISAPARAAGWVPIERKTTEQFVPAATPAPRSGGWVVIGTTVDERFVPAPIPKNTSGPQVQIPVVQTLASAANRRSDVETRIEGGRVQVGYHLAFEDTVGGLARLWTLEATASGQGSALRVDERSHLAYSVSYRAAGRIKEAKGKVMLSHDPTTGWLKATIGGRDFTLSPSELAWK